ncbi:hypothetical protein HPB50_006743 [Hyalomma asiaticum]|uniref:Uncharacterized protein n=1 Tax=Hyalomma asiaticum TaxID=266040 RepID=A0ACB7TBX0_HYAAI|nr:hypothetical protein HPB50_006743 [Hyalomma asiaticum]
MNATIPPPPFLQCPGVPPISWQQWRPVLQVYIDAAARDAAPEHKKALLLNALGVDGLNCYLRAVDEEQQPGADRGTPEDAYNATLDALKRIFNPHQDPACVRAQFKYLCQRPDETAVEFIQEVQRQVKLCEFGAAGELLAFDQIVTGISSMQLQRTFFKMGKDFTVQKALSVAREEERVDRALQQFSGAHMAPPRVGLLMAMANMADFLPEVRGKMAPAFFLLGAPPPPPVLPPVLLLGLLPPRLRHSRLVWVRASAAARRSTGPTPAPSLLGAAPVGGVGSAGTSLKQSSTPSGLAYSGPPLNADPGMRSSDGLHNETRGQQKTVSAGQPQTPVAHGLPCGPSRGQQGVVERRPLRPPKEAQLGVPESFPQKSRLSIPCDVFEESFPTLNDYWSVLPFFLS